MHQYAYLDHLHKKCQLTTADPTNQAQSTSFPSFYALIGNLDVDTPLGNQSLDAARRFCGYVYTLFMYIHMHTYTHAYTHTCIHMYIYTYHIYIRTYIHTYKHTHTYAHMHTHTYIYTHMHTHTHIYTHMHTRTYVMNS